MKTLLVLSGIVAALVVTTIVLYFVFRKKVDCYAKCLSSYRDCVSRGVAPNVCSDREKECEMTCLHAGRYF